MRKRCAHVSRRACSGTRVNGLRLAAATVASAALGSSPSHRRPIAVPSHGGQASRCQALTVFHEPRAELSPSRPVMLMTLPRFTSSARALKPGNLPAPGNTATVLLPQFCRNIASEAGLKHPELPTNRLTAPTRTEQHAHPGRNTVR
ncbi:uncharacterized protein BDZ99DRAFT_170369 [Mytilinidion resinicola]|uniref:Uncharacterized protein n=1 Tax=Mytilinidion resinicola TaxID=574789 RepID=A0A6A6Y448_9PEZI|nr:uncharacterized protein BDZ99DRAFT_170369 [Mytilinidion resinicola]KAF2803293.1 hypothetical protein BDZ99DRAFT_170369 [Mytilinidion resinicola]